MATIPHGTWVMVGDGEKALFLRNEGDEAAMNLSVLSTLEQDNPPTRDQGSDAPGRFNDGPNAAHSAVEDTDWHTIEKVRFASEIAERLYKAAHHNRFEKIVIAAPPMILGELRKEMHKEVEARVLFDLDKELTGHTVGEIEKVLTAA